MSPPQEVYILNSGTYEYVMLCGKKELKLQIELKLLIS